MVQDSAMTAGNVPAGRGKQPEMAFMADPNNGRMVFDPESGHALIRIFRDVPNGEAWFDLELEGCRFLVKSDMSWSEERRHVTCRFHIDQLESSFRQWLNPRSYQPTPAAFRATALPALREAVTAYLVRNSGSPRIPREPLQVDVIFIEPAVQGVSRTD